MHSQHRVARSNALRRSFVYSDKWSCWSRAAMLTWTFSWPSTCLGLWQRAPAGCPSTAVWCTSHRFEMLWVPTVLLLHLPLFKSTLPFVVFVFWSQFSFVFRQFNQKWSCACNLPAGGSWYLDEDCAVEIMNVMKMMVMKTKTKRKLVLKMILMVGNGEYGAIRSIFQSKFNPHENSHMLQRKLQGWVRCSNHPARRERRSNFKKISPLLPSQFYLLGYLLKRWNNFVPSCLQAFPTWTHPGMRSKLSIVFAESHILERVAQGVATSAAWWRILGRDMFLSRKSFLVAFLSV